MSGHHLGPVWVHPQLRDSKRIEKKISKMWTHDFLVTKHLLNHCAAFVSSKSLRVSVLGSGILSGCLGLWDRAQAHPNSTNKGFLWQKIGSDFLMIEKTRFWVRSCHLGPRFHFELNPESLIGSISLFVRISNVTKNKFGKFAVHSFSQGTLNLIPKDKSHVVQLTSCPFRFGLGCFEPRDQVSAMTSYGGIGH